MKSHSTAPCLNHFITQSRLFNRDTSHVQLIFKCLSFSKQILSSHIVPSRKSDRYEKKYHVNHISDVKENEEEEVP
jgi:hypothetical protein